MSSTARSEPGHPERPGPAGPDQAERNGRERLDAHDASWALWEVLRTAEEAQHAMARELGLPTTDAVALDHVLRTTEPIGPGELARRLDISTASATALVDRLVASGHLVREPDPRDGRRRALAATEYGHRHAVEALTPLLTRLDAVAADLEPEAARAVVTYLRAIARVQREYTESTTQQSR